MANMIDCKLMLKFTRNNILYDEYWYKIIINYTKTGLMGIPLKRHLIYKGNSGFSQKKDVILNEIEDCGGVEFFMLSEIKNYIEITKKDYLKEEEMNCYNNYSVDVKINEDDLKILKDKL